MRLPCYCIQTKEIPVILTDTISASVQIKEHTEANNDGISLELLECFYNAKTQGAKTSCLDYKNGRTALNPMENLFLTHSTSVALGTFSFTDKNKYFPTCPFHYAKNSMKKIFALQTVNISNHVYQIRFSPRKESDKYFSGEVWIDSTDNSILRLEIYTDKTKLFPFIPYLNDKMSDVGMEIVYPYIKNGEKTLLNYISFSYSFIYTSKKDKDTDLMRPIFTKGILFLYDYNDSFILPLFNYDESFDDYQKMQDIPYNSNFWKNADIMFLTDKQKSHFKLNDTSTSLKHFYESNYGNDFLNSSKHIGKRNLFNSRYCFWSQDKRLVILHKSNITNQDMYELNIDVQVFLDVTEINKKYTATSYVVSDSENKKLGTLPDSLTNLISNLYFDLCEIERLKMEKHILNSCNTIEDIYSAYNKTKVNIEDLKFYFLHDINFGYDSVKPVYWNEYVLKETGINNIQINSFSRFYKNFMHDYKDIIHSDTIEIELYKNYYKLYDINDSARILQFYRY